MKMNRIVQAAGILALCVAGSLTALAQTPPPAPTPAPATPTPTTLDNLTTAFNEEMHAKAHYDVYAAKADEEGYRSAAALFRAAAAAENILATKHAAAIEALGGKAVVTPANPQAKSTAENLAAGVQLSTAGETSRYAGFAAQAELEKNARAAMQFKGATAAQASLAKLFTQAAADPTAWKDAGKEIIVCKICAYTTLDTKLKTCPVCAAPRSKFELFN